MKVTHVFKGVLPVFAAAGLMISASASAADGKVVFESVCKMCHGTGVGGAPKLGDKAAWEPRIAQGMETLDTHAIKGFKGKALMPPKGGRASLSDDEVKAAVQYMVDAAK